ncbi:MAG: molybdopterin synthase catalytic subunit MoaE [Methylophilaceae bacterium]|jgi:molybdopterin synthase catalytic subunit|nr:molybdopterin synthase catalytic subunit MoaE [Methyloradius sp.]
MPVKVQAEDFDVGAEINRLRLGRPDTGAVVSFVGQVRDLNDGEQVNTLTLEHYPGMTEAALENIIATAKQRWNIFDALVIHRVGELKPTEQIVLVAVSGAHRGEAFSACEFIMDFLKTEAPFWKKEQTPNGERWVEAKISDDAARERWNKI